MKKIVLLFPLLCMAFVDVNAIFFKSILRIIDATNKIGYAYTEDYPNDVYILAADAVDFICPDSLFWDDYGNFYERENHDAKIHRCGVRGILDRAFFSTSTLQSVTFNNIIWTIGQNSFYNTGLTKVEFPQSLTEIDTQAFGSCILLTEITFPDSLLYLGVTPFINTRFSNNPDNWDDWALYGDKYLLQVAESLPDTCIIKEGTRLMCRQQFYNHTEIKYVECPEGMISVPEIAFAGCTNLKKVVLPSTITEVGTYSFGNCPELDTIVCNTPIPPAWTERSINGYQKLFGTDFYKDITVVVPENALAFYKINSNWKKFNLVGMTTDIDDIKKDSKVKSEKLIENGQIIILHDGKRFNVLGAEVK